MNKEQVITTIRNVCSEIGAPANIMLAIAHVETGGKFNVNARSSSGTYAGIFQLSDGYGGCKGDDRYDVAKATRCTWKNLSDKRKQFEIWEDWYYYGIHQQGLNGFKTILKERFNTIENFSRPPKVLINNLPTAIGNNLKFVYEGLDY
jgi:hypothetical protein